MKNLGLKVKRDLIFGVFVKHAVLWLLWFWLCQKQLAKEGYIYILTPNALGKKPLSIREFKKIVSSKKAEENQLSGSGLDEKNSSDLQK